VAPLYLAAKETENNDGTSSVSYSWGIRAQLEFKKSKMLNFVVKVNLTIRKISKYFPILKSDD